MGCSEEKGGVVLLKIDSSHQYDEYLKSEHWIVFSNKIKRERDSKCEDCGIEEREATRRDRQHLNVHHLTYKNLGNEKPEDVVVVCHYCHLKRHGIEGFYEWCQKFSMPKITAGSHQACASCGLLAGPVYYNVGEVLPEWLCADCRR